MKIIVLGGAGDMGAEAVRDLARFSGADKISIADRNVAAAEKLVASLDTDRVDVVKVDASNHAELVEALRGYSAVAGALGPFYRFEKPIVTAALEAGVDYVSICDDHDAAAAVLQLDEEAREKGRRILPGLGWTPGMSNILARKGYDDLDDVESIRVYWAGSAGDSQGFAVVLHTMHIFTGMVTSFQDDKFIEVKAGSGKETIEFPAPLGKVDMYHLGHPEPVTLPRYLSGLQNVTLKGGLAEAYLNTLARMLVGLGLTSNNQRKQRLGVFLKKVMPLFPVNEKKCFSGIRVDVTGWREGEKVTTSYAAVDHMNRLTGIPLSIGVTMMAEGRIKRLGVYGPEADGAIEPGDFLTELARRGVKTVYRELEA
jgi:saccharopine dehydrogenase-like NADP-dependent oxidoreductase